MSASPRSRATVADLVVLAAVLKRDEARPAGEVRVRDARIGASLRGDTDDRTALILGWLERIAGEDATIHGWSERVTAALQICAAVVGGAGLVLGWLAALGTFYYEGAGRVNVIAVLVVLVGVPTVFLVAFVAAALPRRWIGWLPGAVAVSALARALSPGRLAHLVLRFAPRDVRETITGLQTRAGEHQRILARVQKWLLLRWSQVFAVAFQCGAVSAALALVLFSDLVFGWSTTLASGDPARDAARVHAITTAVSEPWRHVLPDAVPGPELIRESRYYRVVSEAVSPDRASRLGGWWSFLVVAMLVYGMLPRLLALAVAARQLSVAVDHAVQVTPGVPALARRLQAARVQTSAADPEESAGAGVGGGPADSAPPLRDDAPVRAVINWAEVPVADEELRSILGAPRSFHAGGASTLREDQRVVEDVAKAGAAGPGAGVAIVVKAWEPPLLEFIDFVQALRRALDDGAEIFVYPVVADESGAPASGSAAQIEVWRRRLGRAGDPWLRVVAWSREGGR